MGTAARVAIVGANGYGIQHRRVVARLQAAGRVELVGLCDLAPIEDVPTAPVPPDAVVGTDYRELLAVATPDIVIIATPPHTHAAIAIAAARAGADILVEKPPVCSRAEHDELSATLAETGRVCQVGFQALGSRALSELVRAIGDGRLGTVVGIGACGAWDRPDAYYRRSPWAGRREYGGRPVLDGALANPFAHALMQTLAVAAAVGDSAVEQVELERYRARPIEVDDTGAVRLRLASGIDVVVAVTLCADEVIDPVLHVRGTEGTADLEYTTDRLRLPGEREPQHYSGRVNLLDNLLANRDSADSPLVAGLEMTAPFTTVIDHITRAPLPAAIPDEFIRVRGAGPNRVVTVPGISAAVQQAAQRLLLLSDVDLPWAKTTIATTAKGVQEQRR